MAATLVAGVDSSTQSTKIVVCDADTGTVVRQARAPHPDGTSIDPARWWDAYQTAAADGVLDGVEAIAVGGQQHGMVALDADGTVIRDALLWNDTRSAHAATDLIAELGGEQAWVDAVNLVPVAAFTVSKLRWLADHEPSNAAKVDTVVLPHDWVSGRILHGHARVPQWFTDRGDASGTGYWSPQTGEYRQDLVRLALGHDATLPTVLPPAGVAGRTASGMLVAAGTGDNMGAGLGLGLAPGDVVVSLGTSGTVFAVNDGPVRDASGNVAGFADATGGFLPLMCTLNAARVLTSAARMLGVDLAELERLALAAQPGSGGLSLLPYLDHERTPNLPDAAGTLGGLTRANMTPENLARAAVEGMLCNLAEGVDSLTKLGVEVNRILLIGGASASKAVQEIAPQVFGAPVVVPAPGEYVGIGAARQAAWALTADGASAPVAAPDWPVAMVREFDAVTDDSGAQLRARYSTLLHDMHGL